MLSRELRILRDALKHEQAVARGRIGNIKGDAYNKILAQSGKRDLLSRSSYVDLDKSVLSLKKFDAIKDESLKKSEMESALKTLKERNSMPRGKTSYVKETIGTKGKANAKSFFDKLVSGDVKDIMHEQLNYGDSDDVMDFIMEHKEGTTEVTEQQILEAFGEDAFAFI